MPINRFDWKPFKNRIVVIHKAHEMTGWILDMVFCGQAMFFLIQI